MQAELISPSRISVSDQFSDIDINEIRGRFSAPATVTTSGTIIIHRAVSGISVGGDVYYWTPFDAEDRLEQLDPKGDALDALVAKFPAPKVWYEED